MTTNNAKRHLCIIEFRSHRSRVDFGWQNVWGSREDWIWKSRFEAIQWHQWKKSLLLLFKVYWVRPYNQRCVRIELKFSESFVKRKTFQICRIETDLIWATQSKSSCHSFKLEWNRRYYCNAVLLMWPIFSSIKKVDYLLLRGFEMVDFGRFLLLISISRNCIFEPFRPL